MTVTGGVVNVGALATAGVVGTKVGGAVVTRVGGAIVTRVGGAVVTRVGGAVVRGDLPVDKIGETTGRVDSFVVGVALSSSVSKTAMFGCWTMMCMLVDSWRLFSVEGPGAWSGTPPKLSSLGVMTTDNDLVSGLIILAEVGVDPGLTLGRSFLAAAP